VSSLNISTVLVFLRESTLYSMHVWFTDADGRYSDRRYSDTVVQ